VLEGTNLARYTYVANSPLVGQIAFSNRVSSQWHLRMSTVKQYDYLNRLTFVGSTPASGVGSDAPPLPSFTYTYNNANQRVRVNLADGSYWLYEYDALGQVISGRRYWPDGTPVAGQQFEYGFDHIGNRTQTKAGGDENGWNLRTATYTANLLNQYTSRTVPGYVDILGVALATKTVTVNGQAAYRKLEYFRRELSVNNASAPAWEGVTVSATCEPSVTGRVFVPRTPEQFSYDLDGNLTVDGRWNYTWDAENWLVMAESFPSEFNACRRGIVRTYDGERERILWVLRRQGHNWVSRKRREFRSGIVGSVKAGWSTST
ncbi:MAG: hypothetical protein NZ739_11560, partial [Verrucomicrobiae bacterium]|nr:hypothetical protein [Verrucomicrobiae bacterium]